MKNKDLKTQRITTAILLLLAAIFIAALLTIKSNTPKIKQPVENVDTLGK